MRKKTRKNFEKQLPPGYRAVFHIDARNIKTGLIFSLLSFIPLALMIFIFSFTLEISFLAEIYDFSLCMLGIFVGIFVYMVLHELTHGIVYKKMTGRKLTFGISWSCAFCGVPDIYVYRKTAILALLAPFVVFTALFLPLTIFGYFFNPYLYLLFGTLFAMHVGGCSGDLYMFFLLAFRFKKGDILMRDTGPEQWIYTKMRRVCMR